LSLNKNKIKQEYLNKPSLQVTVRYQEPMSPDEEPCIIISFPEKGGTLAIPVSCWSVIEAEVKKLIAERKTKNC